MQLVYLDNNIWDYLYEHDIHLPDHFPRQEVRLAITRHGRYEIDQIPDCEKPGLKGYIRNVLGKDVEVVSTFGFKDPAFPDDQQRVAGFGAGTFTTEGINAERQRLSEIYAKGDKRKEHMILRKQEADIELAALSLEHHVITRDAKSGPLTNARDRGGLVIFLDQLDGYPDPRALDCARELIRAHST